MGLFDSLYCPEGRAFLQNDCPGGGLFYRMIVPAKGFLLPSSRVPGGMVMDEIDTCIT